MWDGAGMNAQFPDAPEVGGDGDQPRQVRRRDFLLSNLFNDQFFKDVDPKKKKTMIEKMYEGMFFPVQMKNIANLDFFIRSGIDINTHTALDEWGEEKTAAESILTDFLLKIRAATNYVRGRTQLHGPQGHERMFIRR